MSTPAALPDMNDGARSTTARPVNTRTERRRLLLPKTVILGAIGLLVVVVSLPKLRAFALRENEYDAMRMLRLLASDAAAHGGALRAGGLGALLATNDSHRVRLEDVELCADGRLRRHGYLFDAVETAPNTWTLRAWPWEHPHTGLGAFVLSPGGDVLGFRNEDGACSGPARPPLVPRDPAAEGWVPMRADTP